MYLYLNGFLNKNSNFYINLEKWENVTRGHKLLHTTVYICIIRYAFLCICIIRFCISISHLLFCLFLLKFMMNQHIKKDLIFFFDLKANLHLVLGKNNLRIILG